MITLSQLEQVLQPLRQRVSELERQEPGAGILVPPLHSPTHEPGGTDPLVVDALATIGSLRTIGTGAVQAAPGNLSPTADQKDALVGTFGTPSATNEYVTDSDPRLVPSTPYVSPFYNVKDYGAIGSGAINDFPAIQAAITAWQVTGGTLLFPQGNYLISSQLFMTAQSNKHYEIYGMGGATITVDNAMTNNGLLCDGVESSSLTIQNLAIRRATVASTFVDGNGGLFIRPFVSGGVGFEGVWLQNVEVVGFGDEGIVITNCRRVAVMNCRAAQNYRSGLDMEGGSDIVVMGGDYSYNAGNGAGDYGIACGASDIYQAAAAVLITGVNANYNGRKGIDAHHGSWVRIIGNTVIGNGGSAASTPSGIFVDGATPYLPPGSLAKVVKDCVIAYNVIDMDGGVGPGPGVPCCGIQAGIFTDQGEDPGAFIIHGNIISNCDNNTLSRAILIDCPASGLAAQRVVITENSLYNPAGSTQYCIHMLTTASKIPQITISHNLIRCPNTVFAAIGSLSGLAQTILGNIMQFDAGITYGILCTGGPATIVNNVITGTTPAVPFQSNIAAGSTIYGNRVNATIQFDPICGTFENGLRVTRGTGTVFIPFGTRVAELAVSFSYTFAGIPVVICTIQDGSIFTAAEFPVSVTVRAVSTGGCVLTVYLAANAPSFRFVPVGLMVIGV